MPVTMRTDVHEPARTSPRTPDAGALAVGDVRSRIHGDLASFSELSPRDERSAAGDSSDRRTPFPPDRIGLDPENVERGLAKLVLALLELIRRLLERQAIKRLETGSLTDEQTERLGRTFSRLEKKMIEMRELFGLSEEDLQIPLGPLGRLF